MPTSEGLEERKYVGFWKRVVATIIDALLITLVTMPLLMIIYGTAYFSSQDLISGGADFVISWVFPAVAVIVFWVHTGATPGKMAVSARVVDERTGELMSTRQAVIRYVAYVVSLLPLCAGLIWVAFDRRKQGWHDKIAKTVVVRARG